MKIQKISILLGALACATVQPSAQAGEFHFSAGLTYVQGVNKVYDALKSLYTADESYTVGDSVVIPVGISLNPYYEFGSGVAVGLDLGPASMIGIDYGSSVDISYIVPVGADVRYTFLRDKNFSPYVRAGIKYPIVGGPNVTSSELGGFGAVGVDLWRTKRVGVAVEVGYDTSKVTVKGPPTSATKSVEFPGLTASLCVRF